MKSEVSERQKVEARMMWLFEQLVNEYLEYNPEGTYLSLTYRYDEDGKYMTIYNANYRDEGVDKERPIDVSKFDDEMVSFMEVK